MEDGSGEVAFAGGYKESTNITIASSVKIQGYSFKITAVEDRAFKNYSKLKKVTIGANITTIGDGAFYGCNNLKTIVIKSTKLTSKTVGAKAFLNTNNKAILTVPKSKLEAYTKLFREKGISKEAIIKY